MVEKTFRFKFDRLERERLDKFLVSCLPDQSRSRIQGLIKEGYVKVNNVVVTKNGHQLENEKLIDIVFPPLKQIDLIPEAIPLEIIFEDDDIIVINKKAGMVVHPSVGHLTGTLIHAVLSHAPEIEGVGGVQRPGIIHRLDKNTSGLIVFAKNDKTHQWIQTQFSTRKVKKSYGALVDGHPPTPEGRIEAPIGRDPYDRKKMAVVNADKGRCAYSEYYTIKRFINHEYLGIHLLTGRTHQIRLHLKFIGCPVVGDTLYGRKHPSILIDRTFLHAKHLEFFMPEESTPRIFDAPLPDELDQILKNLN